MTTKFTLRAAALASTCLLPLAAFAQEAPDYNNEATMGTRFQSSDSALFGRYSGTPFGGFYGTGSFKLDASDAWNSGKTEYFLAEGDNLDVDGHQLFPDAELSVKYGERGKWGIQAFYDGIPYWQSLGFHSLYNSSGALKGLTPGSLPVNSGLSYTPPTADPVTGALSGGATPGELAAGQSFLNGIFAAVSPFNSTQFVGTQRDIVGGSATYMGLANWTFSTGLKHEHKQGTMESSFATNDMNNALAFPEPVDWDTDTYSASARYSTKQLKAVFSYTFSNFNDNLTSFNTLNPFNLSDPSLQLAPGYVGSIYSLPPSNDAHQLKGQVSYLLTPTTRINTDFGYQLMQQNSSNTLAYQGAPANPYLPGGNYNAQIQQMYGNIALNARPLPKTDIRASYSINDREDDSPRVFIPADYGATGQITADTLMSSHVPIANLPISELDQTAKLEAGYHILPSTKVTAFYTYKDQQRDYSVTDRNHESTEGARVNSSLSNTINGMLSYSHSVRSATDYNDNAAWVANTYYLSGLANPAGLGMYYLAARTRDEIKGNLTWSASDALSAGLTGKFYNDHYPTSFYGVTNDHTLSVGPDIAYSPTKSVTTHLFYTFEEVFTDQLASNQNDPSQTAGSTTWSLGNKDTIHTVGASADWQISDKAKISLSENLSYGNTAFAEGASLISAPGSVLPAFPENLVSALPNDTTILNSILLSGEYKLASNVSLLGSYSFDRAVAKDYLYNQPSTAFGNSFGGAGNPADYLEFLPGDGNPSYSIHTVSMAVRVKW